MVMLVDCSHCRTPLELPHGAPSVRCVICDRITHIASPQNHQHPPPPEVYQALPPTAGYQLLPPPYPQVNGPPPGAHGRKKAVICGISYKNSQHELKGCLQDAEYMRHLLTTRFHFPEESIFMLTEEETDPYKYPTKQNLLGALHWLVYLCQPGDSLVFHYSGHGSQLRDDNGDEVDGYDETLLPLDWETQGMIVDDEINEIIVRPLSEGVKLHAIMDSCHSGTVLDLPYLCRMDRTGGYVWEDHRPRSGQWKDTNGGECICFSGCDDHQKSADTWALSKITATGALTYCFIQAIERAIENGETTTYGNILNTMRKTIRNTSTSVGGIASMFAMLTGGSVGGTLTQEPQLTSNVPFDVYGKSFSL